MNPKERKRLNQNIHKPRIEIAYNDLVIDIQATMFQPTTFCDMILLASAILEKASELEHGTPVIKTDLIKK